MQGESRMSPVQKGILLKDLKSPPQELPQMRPHPSVTPWPLIILTLAPGGPGGPGFPYGPGGPWKGRERKKRDEENPACIILLPAV